MRYVVERILIIKVLQLFCWPMTPLQLAYSCAPQILWYMFTYLRSSNLMTITTSQNFVEIMTCMKCNLRLMNPTPAWCWITGLQLWCEDVCTMAKHFNCKINSAVPDPCLSHPGPCDPNADCQREGFLSENFTCACSIPPFTVGDGFNCTSRLTEMTHGRSSH